MESLIDALAEEIARNAFYEGRDVKRYERGVAIFKEQTFEGWLRSEKTRNEIKRLIKLYSK
jgi:hypothetical protein